MPQGFPTYLSYTDASVYASREPKPKPGPWKVLTTYYGVHAGFPTEENHSPSQKAPMHVSLGLCHKEASVVGKLPLAPGVEHTLRVVGRHSIAFCS